MKCEICGKEILRDSQCINYKYYHNDCIENLQQENKQLKKQLEKVLNDYCRLDAYNRTQQKEFIDYMNKTIEELECDDVDDEEIKGYLIQRIDTFKEILSKYKEIIGGD